MFPCIRKFYYEITYKSLNDKKIMKWDENAKLI